jgi:hypothetical protein
VDQRSMTIEAHSSRFQDVFDRIKRTGRASTSRRLYASRSVEVSLRPVIGRRR